MNIHKLPRLLSRTKVLQKLKVGFNVEVLNAALATRMLSVPAITTFHLHRFNMSRKKNRPSLHFRTHAASAKQAVKAPEKTMDALYSPITSYDIPLTDQL